MSLELTQEVDRLVEGHRKSRASTREPLDLDLARATDRLGGILETGELGEVGEGADLDFDLALERRSRSRDGLPGPPGFDLVGLAAGFGCARSCSLGGSSPAASSRSPRRAVLGQRSAIRTLRASTPGRAAGSRAKVAADFSPRSFSVCSSWASAERRRAPVAGRARPDGRFLLEPLSRSSRPAIATRLSSRE